MKLGALIKKEFHRFFRDPRLIVTMLLPGIAIFLLYYFVGEAVYAEPEKYEFKVCLVGSSVCTQLIEEAIADGTENTVEWLECDDPEAAKEQVEKGEASALLLFSEGFDTSLDRPSVTIVYDPLSDESAAFHAIASAVLREVGMRYTLAEESVASAEQMGMEVMQSILPFIVVCFIFSACMSVTLESVAGEKERGTLATILVTSVKRSEIALGKVVPLSCVSMLGALSSFLGMAFSMPHLMGVSLGFLGMYGFLSYLMMFLLILGMVPLIVALVSVLSAYARSVKEASAYSAVVMIVIMAVSLLVSFVPMMGAWSAAIPVLNAVVSLQEILSGHMVLWKAFLSVGMNLAYTGALIFLLARMFSSERIMFGK